jgi:hypothetical protein
MSVDNAVNDKHGLLSSERRRPVSKKKRKVVFYGRVRIAEIPDRSHLTDAHRASLWYSQEELDQQIDTLQQTIDMMVDGTDLSPENEDHCPDGLKTPDEHDLRRQNYTEAIHAVLIEQKLQWEEGEDDPDIIADAYFECTSYNQWLAMEKGARHARVMEALNGPPVKKLGGGCRRPIRRKMDNFILGSNLFEAVEQPSKKATLQFVDKALAFVQ